MALYGAWNILRAVRVVTQLVCIIAAVVVLWSFSTYYLYRNGSLGTVNMKKLSWQWEGSHTPSLDTSRLSTPSKIPVVSVPPTVAENKERKYFQAVADTTTFVYSAYANREEIRIIAIKALFAREDELFCHLWYDVTAGKESVSVVVAQVEDIPENHGTKNTAAFIHCKLPKSPNGKVPVAVSISRTESKMAAESALPVRNLGRMTSTFTWCVSPLNKNYSNIHMLVESIELNRILGADKIVFYNYSISSVTHRVLEHYRNQGLVDIYPWNLPTTDIHYYGQLAALNDCLYQYRNRSRYLVYQDLDEFIIPQTNLTSWGQLLEHRKKSDPKAGIFMVRNVFFRKEWPKPWAKFTLNEKAQKYKSIVLQNTVRENNFFEYGLRSKLILDPWTVDCMGIHFVWKALGKIDNIPKEMALLYHYRSWDRPTEKITWSQDVSVVQRFGKNLVDALDKAWSSLKQNVGLSPDSII